MNKIILFLSLILFFFFSCITDRNKPITIGDEKYDSIRKGIKIKNGYALAGMTTSYGIGGTDGLWLLLNKNYKKIKQNTYGGKNDDKFYDIIQNDINGYLIVGSTNSYGAGNNDVYLVCIDNNGKLKFTRTFGGELFDEGKSICKTNDNNFLIAGDTISIGNRNNFDTYLIKIDNQGNCLWAKTIGGPGNEIISKIIQDNNEFIIIGSSNSKIQGKGLPDIYLSRIDNIGNIIMERYYGTKNSENGYDIIKSKNDNIYYILGNSENLDNLTDIYLIKINSKGDIIWDKKIGGKGLDTGISMIENENKELILIGTTESKGKGMSDIIVLKIDENGRLIWESTFGGDKDEYCSNILKSFKNDYLIIGWTASFGKGDYDIILINVDENGNIY
jgi:hypothetical protein